MPTNRRRIDALRGARKGANCEPCRPSQRKRRSCRGSLYGLGWLPKSAKKRLPHAFPTAESGLACNDFDRMPCRLHHQSSRLHAETLDGLGGRLASLLAEDSTELARAQSRDFGQNLDRKIISN